MVIPHIQLVRAPDIVGLLKVPYDRAFAASWSGEGWDPAAGALSKGSIIEGRAIVRSRGVSRVQARQIYAFAKAAHIGWYPEVRNRNEGLDYLLAKAKKPEWRGRLCSLAESGPVHDQRDAPIPIHAFVLLALSTVNQLSNDAQVRGEIESLLRLSTATCDRLMAGFIEGIPQRCRAGKSADAYA